MISELTKIYDRDISRLKQEIEAFVHEENLWRITGNIKNPAGNLCLHLIGNLKTYIGKNLGNYPYIRDRNAEFNRKDVSKQQLIEQVDDMKMMVLSALSKFSKSQLEQTYVEEALGYPMTNGFFLVHLAAHLSYHLGQINYLRRILE